jgi:hypothetical protein
MRLLAFVLAVVLLGSMRPGFAQQEGCRFLGDCPKEEKQIPRQRTDPKRTFAEHLERCLTDYVRRSGPFVPEGQSTRERKSKSDMTAMCTFAIERSNFYWDYPRNTDDVANLKCCMRMGTDEKTCRENMRVQKQSKVDVDYCHLLSKAGEPPPPDWNVPAGCTSGPCMVTPGYCRSVGYSRMDAASARQAVALMRVQIGKSDKVTQEQLRAVLRVCFGTNG